MKYYKMNDSLFYADNPNVYKNEFLRMKPENADIPSYAEIKNKLPVPVWEGNGSVIDCYDKAWELAWKNLRKADKKAGFVSNYIDTAFNDYLFMWDSSFIVMFGKYASRCFDFQKTLDNFYSHQHKDGFICREICEYREGEQFQRDDPASTGPNILPWAEWAYYLSTANLNRLQKVFDPLLAYYRWFRLNRSWKDGTYWSCGYACGMDNAPRQQEGYDPCVSHGFMSWIDTCSQQYLSAEILIKMAKILGRESEIGDLEAETRHLKKIINEEMWDENTAFYYDMYRDGTLSGIKTVGSYWTMLAGLVPSDKINRFVAHLDNEDEFKRYNRVPSLSADSKGYSPRGEYWRGGVWAPTNYMVLCGLHKYSYDSLAFEIATNYLFNVVQIYEKSGTLYENYAPETASIGYHGEIPAKSDFVGWTGLAPISILFEYVFGIHIDALQKEITWNIRLTDRHGIKQLAVGDATVDLICEKRISENQIPIIHGCSDKPIKLKVKWNGNIEEYLLTNRDCVKTTNGVKS